MAALAGVGEVVLLFARQDFSLSAALSYAVVAQVTEFNRAEYLSGAIDQGVAERLAFLCMYGGALFGGMLFRLSRSLLESILALTPLVLLLVVFGLYGSRMGALYGGSFWIGAYLATTILVGRGRATPSPTNRLAKIGTTHFSSAPTIRMAMPTTATG